MIPSVTSGARQLSRYSNWLQAVRSGDRIPVGARFSAPVQTGPGPHPASCTMGTGSFLGVKSSRGVTLTPHPLLMPWSKRVELYLYSPYGPYGLYRASVPVQGCTLPLPIPLLPLWAVRPVQSLSACTRVLFALPYLTLRYLTFFCHKHYILSFIAVLLHESTQLIVCCEMN